MYRAYVEHGYRMVEIAEYLGVHYATISRATQAGEKDSVRGMQECSIARPDPKTSRGWYAPFGARFREQYYP